MAIKKFFKNNLPKRGGNDKNIKRIRQVLGDNFHNPAIWSLNRHSICRAVFIGLFMLYMPVPSQMLLAAIAAAFFRANLPLSVALVWISNPITILPILYSAYALGAWMMGIPIHPIDPSQGLEWIWEDVENYWQPLLLGCVICGLVTASIGYLVVSNLWAWSVRRSWKQRQEKRQEKNQQTH